MYFYEAAAVILSCVPAGYAGIQTVHPAKAILEDGITPLEARFCVDMVQAASGISPSFANQLVINLLNRYEAEIKTAPSGERFQDCFDHRTGKPSESYQQLYEEILGEFSEMGLSIK